MPHTEPVLGWSGTMINLDRGLWGVAVMEVQLCPRLPSEDTLLITETACTAASQREMF